MNRYGYKVQHGGNVHEARDIEAAAQLIASFYPDSCRASACESLTRDRRLTAGEQSAIIERAAEIIVKG